MPYALGVLYLLILISSLTGCVTSDPIGQLQRGIEHEITLESEKGRKFEAVYYPSLEVNSKTVLLLAGRNGKTGRNEGIAKSLNQSGFNVLSIGYDLMGRKNWTHELSAKRGGSIDIVGNEVATSLNFLSSQENVDMNKIGVLGESMGTWIGLETMARYSNLKSLVMLTPTCAVPDKSYETYSGTIDLVKSFGNRYIFVVGSEEDRVGPKWPTAVEKAEYLTSIMPNAHVKKKYYKGKAHGSEMVDTDSHLMETIIEWFNETI